MDELVTWLRQQLDEDAGLARMAFAEHNKAIAEWSEPWSGTVELGPLEDDLACNDSGVSRHIVNWDPARVLAEVEAKRRILDRYEDALARQQDLEYSQTEAHIQAQEHHDWTLPLLAMPYAGRPGWREEWRA